MLRYRNALLLTALLWLPTIVAEVCNNSTCTYFLTVDMAQTMKYEGKDVKLNDWNQFMVVNDDGQEQVVSTDDVIAADGFPRTIVTINEQFPGPTLEVYVGAWMVVHVTNNLRQRSITVHWHGILQTNTYFMDGAAYITQCPIPPMQSFVYRFVAEPAGTHWYHSHMATLRGNGLFGLLIAHDPQNAEELRTPYFPITVSDWFHDTSEVMELENDDLCENGAQGVSLKPADTPDCSIEGAQVNYGDYVSSLFDGRGRYNGDQSPFPLKQYVVTSGQRYRFRLVNVGAEFSFQISIDGGHQIWIVASDGAPIQPLLVDSFYIFVAESIDFEVVADRPPGRYWIRTNSPCGERYGFGVKAVLAYRGYETLTEDPTSSPTSCTGDKPCRVFNCPFDRYPIGSNSTCITMGDARSTLSTEELSSRFGIGRKVDEVHFLNFAMNVGSSINGRRFRFPSTPLFQQVDARGSSSKLSDCVAQRFPTYDPTTGLILSSNRDVTCGGDQLCSSPIWYKSRSPQCDKVTRPVVKDSVVLPIRGYQVLQFVTTNPGLFLMHCHVDMHMMEGMTIVLRIGAGYFPLLPEGFPTCDQFE